MVTFYEVLGMGSGCCFYRDRFFGWILKRPDGFVRLEDIPEELFSKLVNQITLPAVRESLRSTYALKRAAASGQKGDPEALNDYQDSPVVEVKPTRVETDLDIRERASKWLLMESSHHPEGDYAAVMTGGHITTATSGKFREFLTKVLQLEHTVDTLTKWYADPKPPYPKGWIADLYPAVQS